MRVAGLLPPQVRGILSSTIQRDSEHSLTDLHSPAFQILRSQAVGSLHVPRHALMSASTSQFSRISITRDDAVATGGSLAQLRRLLLVHGSPAAATACRSTYPLHLPAVACRRVSIDSLTVIACMYHSPLSYLNWDSGVPGTPDCRRVLVRCEAERRLITPKPQEAELSPRERPVQLSRLSLLSSAPTPHVYTVHS